MATYIRFTLKGHYLELENELDPNDYPDLGSTWEDYLSDVWVPLSDEQIEFKKNNPKASVKEVFDMQLQEDVTPEITLDEIKDSKRREVLRYDSSNNVNIFYINDIPVWLDKATRAGLKLRFEAEIATDKTETTLWYNNMQFPLSLESAIKMLYTIELYASECYDNTQRHIANIEALEKIEDVEKYDYTTGYPDKLSF